tara:strand:+ start:3870 stop:4088 length:219 start_codon:yes stop_codon:yes gene_type:complete
MKGKMIDVFIYACCILVGLGIGDVIGSRVNNVDATISENTKRIERMQIVAAQIDLKMGLILEKVKGLENKKQ